MKLNYSKIPKEFLENIPRGLKYVLRNGKDFLVVEQVFCPNGHSLMVDSVRLHGEPSIKIVLRVGKSEGSVFLDSFWGSHDKLYEFIPDVNQTECAENDVCCPTCGCSLVAEPKSACGACGSEKVFEMHFPGGKNKIIACAKLGCPWHKIVAEDVPEKDRAIVDDINYFGI